MTPEHYCTIVSRQGRTVATCSCGEWEGEIAADTQHARDLLHAQFLKHVEEASQ